MYPKCTCQYDLYFKKKNPITFKKVSVIKKTFNKIPTMDNLKNIIFFIIYFKIIKKD